MPEKYPLLRIDAIGGGATLLILVAAVMLAILPAVNARKERTRREEEFAALQVETEQAVAALQLTKARLRESEQLADTLPNHLRNQQDLNEKIAQIVAETESQGLEVQSIEPGEASRGDRYTRTPIELNTKASIASIARYLHQLHESSPDLALTTLEIRNPDEAGLLDTTIRAEWITLAQ